MSNIQLTSDFNSYVLIWLFNDAMRKLGKRNKVIKSINYDVINGLVVIDEDDIVWEVETHARVKIPQELFDSRVPDSEAGGFCVECNVGIKDSGTCDICKYLNKI
jgi:hypothetical protein